MFRFVACCSKLLFLAIAISLLGNCVDGDDAASSTSSDAFGDDGHLLLAEALDYFVDSEGIVSLTLQKYAISAEVKLVIPEQEAITFIALRPKPCSGDKTPIGFSYAEGCRKSLVWTESNIKIEGSGELVAHDKRTFSIKKGSTKMTVGDGPEQEVELCPTNFKKNDESAQGGYLATFKLFGQYQCDFSVQFPPGYMVFDPPIVQVTTAPSQTLKGWEIAVICVGILVVLVVVGIAVYCICSYRKRALPTTSETKASAPTAVTCLQPQKLIKTSATTQPATVSSDMKQGIPSSTPTPSAPPSSAPPSSAPPSSAPPSSAPPSSAPPQESDDERFERRVRERRAKFKAVSIELPPVPAPILETASQRRPSAEFRRTLESRDESELAPNTVKLNRYERERSRKMLKAVDEGDQTRSKNKKSISKTIEGVM